MVDAGFAGKDEMVPTMIVRQRNRLGDAMSGARILLIAAFCCAASLPSNAAVINVLVVDYESTDLGARYSEFFGELANNSTFANHTLIFQPTVTSLTGQSLDGIGLIIAGHDHLRSLTATDATAIANHVATGASVLAIGHSFGEYNTSGTSTDSLSALLSNRFTNNFGNPYDFPSAFGVIPSGSVPAGTPVNNSFGNLDNSLVSASASHFFSSTGTGASGTFAIRREQGGDIEDGLYGSHGSGRYVMVGSVDMFGGADTTGDNAINTSSQYSTFANNRNFALNSVEFLLDGVTITAVPEPSSMAVLSILGITVLGGRRRHKREKALAA